MSTKISLTDKLRAILEIPLNKKEEKKEVEVKASEEIKLDAPAATAPATDPADTDDDSDIYNAIEQLASAVADLQSRVSNLESEASNSNVENQKLMSKIEQLSKQPTGAPIKQTEPKNWLTKKTEENTVERLKRFSELNKMFGGKSAPTNLDAQFDAIKNK